MRSDVRLPLLVSFGADKISATRFLIELLSEVVKSASDTPMTAVIERAKTIESDLDRAASIGASRGHGVKHQIHSRRSLFSLVDDNEWFGA